MPRKTYSLLLGLILISASKISNATSVEDKLLVAYIYNISKFVTWPDGTLASQDPLHICFYGDSNTVSDSITALKNKKINSHPIEISKLSRGDALSTCQIAYIAESEAIYISPLLKEIKDKPILTFSKTDNFINTGGMVYFFYLNNKLRFDINKRTIDAANLNVSTEILRLAREVTKK